MAGLTLLVSEALITLRKGSHPVATIPGVGSAWLCGIALSLWWLLGSVAVAEPQARSQIFGEFKNALDQGNLTQAEALAESLVTSTEQEFGNEARELVNPLTNWGTVAFRAGRFTEAEERYQRALALLEGQRSGADRLLIRPLQGLGETWLASGRAAEAALMLRRAVDLSRNLDGLYNLEQLDLADALIEAYVQTGQTADAEREHQFAYRTAETSFGKNDLRLIEPLDRYARWFESTGRYSTARGLHARALQLAEQLSSDNPLRGIPALRGLARTWFLEAVYGPEVEQQAAMPQLAESPGLMVQQPGNRFSGDGEKALRYAIDIAKERAPDNPRLQGELLTELGDWYLASGNRKTRETYAEAWQALERAADDSLESLKAPRLLVYRAPPLATSRLLPENPDEYRLQTVEVQVSVDENGKVSDAKLKDDAAELPEATARSVIFALRRARYAPRLEAGVPVATAEVSFSETLWLRVSKQDPPAATP